MSKIWKVVISIVIAVVVIGAAGAGGFIAGRNWTLRAVAQRSRPVTQSEGRSTDTNKDVEPNQGRFFAPGFERGGSRQFGRGFQPGRGRPFGLFLAPFFFFGLMGGLISLAVLALLISLTVYIYYRWHPAPLVPAGVPVNASEGPTEVDSASVGAPVDSSRAGESTDS